MNKRLLNDSIEISKKSQTVGILVGFHIVSFMQKESKARIKINNLLQESGWRFFDTEKEQTNIQLEPNVKIT